MLESILVTLTLAGPPATAPAPALRSAIQLPAVAVGVVPPQGAQDDDGDEEEPKPDKRPEIKELLAQLAAHAKKRGKEDQQAIEVVDQLLEEFERSGLKDRAAIVKGLSACLKQKRQEKDGVRDNKLYLACATAMGHMGPESVKPLSGWIGHKTHRKDLPLQQQLIRALGQTARPAAIDTLTDLLDHRKATIQGAAAEALGNFDGEESDTRKEIFEEILKVLTSVKNRVLADVNDIIARERYDVIAAPMITTMQLLSGHDERDPSQWQRWWNKNKRRDWDEED